MRTYGKFARKAIGLTLLMALHSCKTSDGSKVKDATPPLTIVECQTREEIARHLINDRAAYIFYCHHKVQDPAKGLSGKRDIPTSRQLPVGFEIVFLTPKYDLSETDMPKHCTRIGKKLGEGWHLPLVSALNANKRAASYNVSAEAIGEYFSGSLGKLRFYTDSMSIIGIGRPPYSIQMVGDTYSLWWDEDAVGTGRVICVRP
ncbi:MAG: hypothetical protein WCO71_10315 [Pseudomonadota bacterium]